MWMIGISQSSEKSKLKKVKHMKGPDRRRALDKLRAAFMSFNPFILFMSKLFETSALALVPGHQPSWEPGTGRTERSSRWLTKPVLSA